MSCRARSVAWILAGALIGIYSGLPLTWVVSLSFKRGDDIHNRRFWPTAWTLENYRTVLQTPLFTRALRNSLGISLIATLLSVLLATFAAYALTRLPLPGKKIVLSTTLAVAMFPVISLVGSLFNIWRSVGLYDTWAGLVIPYMSFTLPLSIWMLSAFFRQIPLELGEAAKMDGATGWQVFHKVIAPLAAPGVATAAIVTFFFAWNDFVFGISLTSTDKARTVPAALAFFPGASQFQEPAGAIAAAATLVTLPVLALVFLFQRRIIAGLTSGAVKG